MNALRKVWAWVRHDAMTASSYKMRFVLSLLGLGVSTIPVYFVARGLQPLMASKTAGQGGDYFSFILVGLAAQQFVFASASALPRAIQSSVRTGTFEALLATPTTMSTFVIGLYAFPVLWAMLEAVVLLGAGAALGVSYSGETVAWSLLITLLIAGAYMPFGLLGACLVLMFRTSGPLPTLVGAGSVLLGGVYYPTSVIPGFLHDIASFVPLRYGTEALRRTLLEGEGIQAVWREICILFAISGALTGMMMIAFQLAVKHARRVGTLGQY